MSKKIKFTFKRNGRPKGLAKVVHQDTWKIKLNKKWIGTIYSDYSIGLMVIKKDPNEDGNPNCKWKWIKLKVKPQLLEEAKEYINNNAEQIYNLGLITE